MLVQFRRSLAACLLRCVPPDVAVGDGSNGLMAATRHYRVPRDAAMNGARGVGNLHVTIVKFSAPLLSLIAAKPAAERRSPLLGGRAGLYALGWGYAGSARKTAKPTVPVRDTHHSRAQCRAGLSMEAEAGASCFVTRVTQL